MARQNQERIAHGMGKNGKALAPWVAHHEHLLDAYNAGRAKAGLEPVEAPKPHNSSAAGASTGHDGDHDDQDHDGDHDDQDHDGDHDDQDHDGDHDGELGELGNEIKDGLEEPTLDEPLPDQPLLTLREAKRHAKALGRRGEPLPEHWRHEGALRRAHRAGQRDAEPWRHPLLGANY